MAVTKRAATEAWTAFMEVQVAATKAPTGKVSATAVTGTEAVVVTACGTEGLRPTVVVVVVVVVEDTLHSFITAVGHTDTKTVADRPSLHHTIVLVPWVGPAVMGILLRQPVVVRMVMSVAADRPCGTMIGTDTTVAVEVVQTVVVLVVAWIVCGIVPPDSHLPAVGTGLGPTVDHEAEATVGPGVEATAVTILDHAHPVIRLSIQRNLLVPPQRMTPQRRTSARSLCRSL